MVDSVTNHNFLYLLENLNQKIMKNFNPIQLIAVFIFLFIPKTQGQIKQYDVQSFEKVVISPHIEVVFEEGDQETVRIENIRVPLEKLNVEVNGRTLLVYLEGAKTTTKTEIVKDEEWKGRKAIYDGTMVRAIITYKTLKELSLRGEEKFLCKSAIEAEEFDLSLFGETEVVFNEIKFNELKTSLYGENELIFKKGTANQHRIISYGENEVQCMEIESDFAKITSYGEADFSMFVNKEIKLTAYGESNLEYKGQPLIKKGIVIGDTTVRQIN